MSTEAVEKTTHELDLFPIHEVFLGSFFAPNAVPYHSLISPCGAGTFTLLVTLIQRAINHHGANRVFVIIPSHLHEACHLLLRGKSGACSVERVTVARFRELEARKLFGESLWPKKAVVILDKNTADRTEVSYSLATTKWDLVVFDARDTTPSKSEGCIESILQRGYAPRFLLMRIGDNALFDFWSFKPAFESTQWEVAQILDNDGRPVLRIAGSKAQKWKYTSSHAERHTLHQIIFLIGLLSDNDQGKLIRDSLLQRAASGIPALEHGVHYLMKQLISYCGVSVYEESPAIGAIRSRKHEHDPFSEIASQVQTVWQNPFRALERLNELTWALDDLPGDDRLDLIMAKLESWLSESEGNSRLICIFTSFRETASYLHSALADEDYAVHLLVDSAPMADRQLSLGDHSGRLQIVVATSSAAECFPRLNFTEVVHYDLPDTSCEMKLRIGACRSAGQHFVIQSGDEFEAQLWEKHRSLLGW